MDNTSIISLITEADRLQATWQSVYAARAGAAASFFSGCVALSLGLWGAWRAHATQKESNRRANRLAAFQIAVALNAIEGFLYSLEKQPPGNQVNSHTVLGAFNVAEQAAASVLSISPPKGDLVVLASGFRGIVSQMMYTLSAGRWPRETAELFEALGPFQGGIATFRNSFEDAAKELGLGHLAARQAPANL